MFTIEATVDVINVVEGFSFSDVAVFARGYQFDLREGQVSAGQIIGENITAWGFDLGLSTHGGERGGGNPPTSLSCWWAQLIFH